MWKLRNRKQLLKENEKLAKCLGEKAVQLCNSFNQMLQTEEKYFLFDTTKNVGVCVSAARRRPSEIGEVFGEVFMQAALASSILEILLEV